MKKEKYSEESKLKIKELEEKLHQQELEIEKNKSIWRKKFNKGEKNEYLDRKKH